MNNLGGLSPGEINECVGGWSIERGNWSMELARCQIACGGMEDNQHPMIRCVFQSAGGLTTIRVPGCLSSDPKDLPQGVTS